MIQLKTDCLVIQTNDGENIPCSAEWVTFELLGDGAALVDPEVVRHASAAVLHYFKHELQREFVSVGEFSLALEKVLRGFGLIVHAECQTQSIAPPTPTAAPKVLDSNLKELASNAASEGFELLFFPQLRQELKRNLDQSPNVLRFHSLRDCVKQLAGARRWSHRCQTLHDQIIDFLRSCWETEPARRSCALLVV
jgi:hypothetical protein